MSDSTVNGGISPESFRFSSEENQANAALFSRQIGNVAGATTVIGDDGATTPFALASGLDGLYFISGINSVGGTISIEGGNNTLVGGQLGAPAGLAGDWNIGTSGGQTLIRFGSGADTFSSGGADTVFAGGADVLITVADTNSQGTVIDPASGAVTFLGGQSGGSHILAGGTGGGIFHLGTGGNNVAYAGTGNTTLIGGGAGDVLYANTVTGASGTALYASGDETLVGGGVGTDSFFAFSSISGGGNVLMDVSAAQSGQVLWLGGGNDTIMLGAGADSVVASALPSAGDDQLLGWNVVQDVLYLDHLGAPTFQNTSAGLHATLSDGTNITFAGLHDQSAIQIVFGKPGA